jgi:hypothetical protein
VHQEPIIARPAEDVWSAGVLLLVMTSGRFPWSVSMPHDAKYMRFVMKGESDLPTWKFFTPRFKSVRFVQGLFNLV